MSIFTKLSTIKKAILASFLMTSVVASAQIDNYEVGNMGFLRTPMESANGIIMTNNHYSEIYALKGDKLTTLLKANNCGLYTNLSKDGKYLGFKSFDAHDYQAPAILDVTTGAVTILEDYVYECGQVSFANDGTMAYTMGNSLIIRKGNMRKAFDLGFYTNIANISPDGSQVAYSNIEGHSFIINLTTGAKEEIPVLDGYRAKWSPDGSKMAIQTVTGGVFVRENSSKRIFDLGKVESVEWANNSSELIITKQNRDNKFILLNSEIKRVNFDGSNEITLVKASDNLPIDAILTTDNCLVIPYKTGEKRGLAVKNLRTGITPMAASINDVSIIKFDEEDVVGGRISNPNNNKYIKPSPIPADGTIGNLDIPYLNQVYDSPSMSGCTSYGHSTCAATAACMHLGYFGLLNQKATKNRYDGTTKYYAYAIGEIYTSKDGKYTFNTGRYKNCATIYGGYGYMWGKGSPGGGQMGEFYTLNGCTKAVYTESASTCWSQMKSEAIAGRPYPICVELSTSSGHLILGFRTDCYYRGSEGGFVTRKGTFVNHDPYGDHNERSWPNNVGEHSSYDWPGYNSGRANLNTCYWGILVTLPSGATPGTSSEVGIKCDPTSIELTGEVNSTANIYKDVKVTGSGLSTDISVNSATSAITVEKLSGWDDRTGGTIRLKLNTNFTKGAGTYDSYVAVQSTSSYRVEIATKVILTDPAGEETPSTPSTPSIEKGLTQIWKNTSSIPGSAAGGDVRFAAVSNGKLLAIDKANLKIIELTENGQNDYYDCTSALSTHWSASNMGPAIGCDDAGNILIHCGWPDGGSGSNFVLISADLKSTYKIDLSSIEGYTPARVDQMGRIRGNMLSNEGGYAFICPNGGTEALVFKVVNGAIDTDYSQVTNNIGDSFGTLSTSCCAQPAYETVAEIDALLDDNNDLSNAFILRNRSYADQILGWDSNNSALTNICKFTSTTTEGYTTKNASQEGFDWFTLKDKSYYIVPLSSDGTTNGRSSAWAIFNQNDEIVAYHAESLKTGLGQGMGSFIAVPNNDVSVYIYHFIAGTVAEKFIYAAEKTSGIDNVEIENSDAPIEYYNLQGVKVANPSNGIFIKVQGNKASKVLVK